MLWITWHAIVSWHSPHYFRFSFPHHKLATLLFCACLSSFSSITQKRWAMWDQPVAYCPARPPMPFSSAQIPRLGSIISILWSLHYRFPIFSEPRRIDQPVAYCPACLPALSSSLISLPPPSLPISYHASIFIGPSPGVLVNREVPISLNFFNLSHLLTRWNFCFLNAPVASFAWLNIARTILYSFLFLYLARPKSLLNHSPTLFIPFILEANATDSSVVWQ